MKTQTQFRILSQFTPKTEKMLEIREENSLNVEPKLESLDGSHISRVSRRVSQENEREWRKTKTIRKQ